MAQDYKRGLLHLSMTKDGWPMLETYGHWDNVVQRIPSWNGTHCSDKTPDYVCEHSSCNCKTRWITRRDYFNNISEKEYTRLYMLWKKRREEKIG